MIKLVAEIGINHNGDIGLAKRLIDIASIAGFNFVKLQKRTPELCVPKDQLNKMRQTPWGNIRYIEYKKRIEFDFDEYAEISHYCKEKNIKWFASVWDLRSAHFMRDFSQIVKIPSAKIVDLELVKYCRNNFETVVMSTGMSTEKQIETAIEVGNPDVIMHSNSAYPSPIQELSIHYISWLKNKYPEKQIGYSGHEKGLLPTLGTVYLGVDWIERHVTLDKGMWGSDQQSSIDMVEMIKMVKEVRTLELSIGGYKERKIFDSEIEKLKSLRGTE